INTLSIRNEVKAEETIQEFVSSLKQTVLGAYENQNYQFEDLVDKVSVERDTSRNPIFDVVINLLNQAEYSGDISGFNNMEQVHKIGISKFDLTIIAIDYGDQILLSFEYCTQLFKAETIDRFIVYFKQIVSQLARKPEIKITEIDIITEAEKHQLLYEFNNTDADYPKDKTIHQLFEEQVERTPENNALVFQGKEMTYRDLNSKSNQLARLLRNKGVESETIIGLMIESSFELIIGIMGILKAGGAYLPIDPMLPESRKQFMLNNSHSKILLTVSGIASLNVHETLFLESENIYQGRSENLNHINESSDSCYIIYTSGSTGVPKGVIIEHTSVVNFIYSMYNDFKGGFSTLDSCLSLTRFTFDVSVAEYFLPMSFGAKIIFYNSKEVSDIKLLTQAIVDYGITFTYIPPSLLRSVYSLLIQQVDKVKLNKMLVGVEPIKDEILKDYLKLNRDFNIINAYGPTESTICATRYLYKSQLVKNTIVSIGQGLSNTNIYLIDQYNKLVPLGVSGELCISGVGLSRGYLNNPELSSEKFIDHPFKARECLYKTGDLARRLPDGNIEFVGRIDHQVKIRGFRIELGEIENVLLKHKNIKECVVIAIEENRDKYLCAYLVIKEDFNEEEIRTYLSSSLPDYMIPSYFVELEEIPITSNGKVNRKALASPEIKAGDDYVAPSNETEEKIVEIWSEVLNIEKEDISTIANFFSIGGHSLKAANCINKLMNKFDINIPLLEIFKNPTINQLADFIHINKSKTGIDDDHLVLLKEGDVNGENIFLIHDGSGDVDGYIEFCKQANDGINYWGIRAGSLKKYEPTNITIEQLAIKYIKSIKKVQKQGEYNIAGWSLGGTIAFEMIRQLEQEKEKVRFFGIIDSMPPNVNEEVKIKEFTIDSELDWIRKYFDDEVIAGLNTEIDLKDFWLNVIAYLKNIAGASEILKYEIVKNIGFEIKEYEKVSIEDLVKYMNFARSLSKASYNYSPENVINTRISYFAASESKSIRYKNWNIFAQKDMNIKIVKGSHFSIFTQANVKKLYSRFFDCFIACESKILFEP
ncbi:MAG: amino acid adenylation domain-containing protein, partial [Bacteroidales bacterium]|nr:amino acid adenylation domain-containing protein [Bacteroidales bacterium]